MSQTVSLKNYSEAAANVRRAVLAVREAPDTPAAKTAAAKALAAAAADYAELNVTGHDDGSPFAEQAAAAKRELLATAVGVARPILAGESLPPSVTKLFGEFTPALRVERAYAAEASPGIYTGVVEVRTSKGGLISLSLCGHDVAYAVRSQLYDLASAVGLSDADRARLMARGVDLVGQSIAANAARTEAPL